jgi:hypothetical protein
MSRSQVSTTFKISHSTIKRWLWRGHSGQPLAAAPPSGRKPIFRCELWFLPSYSPDLSPIEQAFAKLKTAWRRAQARTPELLYETISGSLPTITASDARSFFATVATRSIVGSVCVPAGSAQRIRTP